MSKLLLLLIFVASLLLAGCSGGDTAAPVGEVKTSAEGQKAVDEGKITKPPKPSTD